ncbi:MAG: hypothetical protein WBL35_01620 [Ornithinibacter sp.]
MTTTQTSALTATVHKDGLIQRITRRRAQRTAGAAAISSYPATRSAAILVPLPATPPTAAPAAAGIAVEGPAPRDLVHAAIA